MKKRKQWLMLVCIALAVCLVSGGMLYIRQKNNNKKWSLSADTNSVLFIRFLHSPFNVHC